MNELSRRPKRQTYKLDEELSKLKVPFDKPINLGNPLYYVQDAISDKFISGDGLYSKKCEELIEREQNLAKVMVTPSCTAALEMSALLAEVQPETKLSFHLSPSFNRKCLCIERSKISFC